MRSQHPQHYAAVPPACEIQARRKSVTDALLKQTPVIGRDRLKRTPPNDRTAHSSYQMPLARGPAPANLESRTGSSPSLADSKQTGD